jgi:hypothetical protein
MTVAVITSVYGGYDQPCAPVPQDTDCEFVLVTDQHYDCDPWKVVIEPRPQLHPRLAAKVAKCRPDLYADADAYIWVDASFAVNSTGFVSWCLTHLDHGPIAQIRHPDRQSIVDEANYSASMPKYQGLPVVAQAQHYVAGGFQDGQGVWATGLIVRRADGWPLQSFGDAWLREQTRWTYQDQVSEPVVLAEHGVRPVDMPGGLLTNQHFSIRSHASHL